MIPSILKKFVQWTLAVPVALILMVLLEDVAPNGQWAWALVPAIVVAVLISRSVVNWVWASERPDPTR
ncbi:hypothetical protein [Lysobacter rhizosphaerae]